MAEKSWLWLRKLWEAISSEAVRRDVPAEIVLRHHDIRQPVIVEVPIEEIETAARLVEVPTVSRKSAVRRKKKAAAKPRKR